MDTEQLHPVFRQMPRDWPIVRVDELFAIQQGKQVSAKHRGGDRQRPFLRTKNVYWGRLDLSELDAMHFSEEDEQRLRLLPGDLLTCEGGWVGRTAVWAGEVAGCLFQNHLHRLRALSSETDPRFALYWLWYAFDIGQIYFGRQNVTTIPNLSKSRLSELPIPSPRRDEQCAIAALLSAVHRAIRLQERLIALASQLKKVLMRQLFTRGTRGEPLKDSEIGSIPQSWEVVRGSEAFEIQQGQINPTMPEFRDMPHLGPENVEPQSGRIGEPRTNAELGIKSGNYFFTREHIVYSKIRPYLNKVALPNFDGTCSADMYPLLPREGHLVREFLFQFLLSEQFLKQATSFQDRTGIPKINRNQLNAIGVVKPSLGEQKEIGRVLMKCDRKVSIHTDAATLLRVLFRTLLQQLMTAQMRVHDLGLSPLEESAQEPVGAA